MERLVAGSPPESARFRVLRTLGAGGMGIVYEAVDREREVRVALKTLRRLTPESLVRFKNEFRALHDLQHPNLVGLGGLFEEQGTWFFTMELVEGADFHRYVRGATALDIDVEAPTCEGPSAAPLTGPGDSVPDAMPPLGDLDEARLRDALRQLATGLEALHRAGRVHRDVKPSNVKVTESGRVVILDFGLVTAVDAGDDSTGSGVVGTVSYMAPEQAAGARVGPEADWYALGVVLFEALTGRLPYEGSPLLRVLGAARPAAPDPRHVVPGLPEDLSALCERLLQFDPADRPTGPEVLTVLGGPAPAPAAAGTSLGGSDFVGRTAELAILRAAFETVRSGRPAAVIVRGPSGVGKTALLRHFAQEVAASTPRAVVLAGRCYEREAVPFKALDGAMAALERRLRRLDPTDAALILGPEAGLVARLFPVLNRAPAVRRAAALQRPEASGPQEVRQRAFAAMRGLLERLACYAPTIVSIDDAQWADADSSALLAALTRPPGAPALLLLVTLRDGERIPAGVPENAVRIDLQGLSPEEGRALVETLLAHGVPAPAAEVSDLIREAEGHPLFLGELVRFAACRDPATRVLRLEDTLLARVDDLDPAARGLLETLAVAGAPVPLSVAAQAAGLSPDAAFRLATVLRGASLARGVRGSSDRLEVYHDRIRETLVGRLDADRIRELHERLAQAFLDARPELLDTRALVRHLEIAGDAEGAALHARRAAELATDALAFDQAADFYRAALRLGRLTEEERRRLQIGLGDALVAAGRCAEGASAYLAVVPGADAAVRLEYRRRAGEQLLVSGHVEQGLHEIRGVLAEVGLALPRTPLRALAALLWYRARLWLRGLRWTERDPSRIAPHDLQRLEIHKALGLGLSIVDNIRGMLFNARGLLLALRTGDQLHVLRSLGIEAAYRAGSGPRRRREVDRLLAGLSAAAGTSGDAFLRAWAVGASGCAAYLMGRFGEAAEKTTLADRLLREQPTALTWELNHIRIFRCYALRFLGRMAELGESLDAYLVDAEHRGDRFAATTMARAFNVVWLARDAPDEARRQLEATAWSPPETGFVHLQHWYWLRAQLELELYEGGAASAITGRWEPEVRSVSGSLLMRIQTVRTELAFLLGRVALARAEAAPGAEGRLALRQARRHARRLAGEGVGHAAACSHLLHAGVAAGEGARDAALEHLRRAVDLAEPEDMRLVAAVAQWRHGRLLGGDDGRALVARAEASMAREGIRRPDRICAAFAPGFDRLPTA